MSITLSHLAVRMTSKKNNIASVVKDSRFYFQTPSYTSNNFADLNELTLTYEDDYYYADLNYIPITLADFTTNSVSAKIAYNNYTSASGVYTYDLYTNISGWQNTSIAIPNGVSFTITVQKWCAVNFVGSPNGQKAYPEGVYPAFGTVTRPPDDGVLDAPEVPGDTQQTIPTGPGGWPAPDKRPFSVVGSIEVAPYVGVSGGGGPGEPGDPELPLPIDPGTPTVSFQTNRSYTSTNTTGSSRNLWLAFNDDETTSPWNYNDNYGFYIVTVTLASGGGDTVDVDSFQGVLSYFHDGVYKQKTLTVDTVTQEDVTVNWNNLNNSKTLNGVATSSDSFGDSETKLLKATFALVTLNDLINNPSTDPLLSTTPFFTVDYIPRWTEPYYSTTKLGSYYTGCMKDTKALTETIILNSFGPSFFGNKNNNYRIFTTSAFYGEIKTVSVFAPSLNQAGTVYNLADSSGALNISRPHYKKLPGNYLELYNIQFIKVPCVCAAGVIDLSAQFLINEPLFDTNFYLLNAAGDTVTFDYDDIESDTFNFNIDGNYEIVYESKTLLNDLILNNAKVYVNGFPIKINYKMLNPNFTELTERYDYHAKHFNGDYNYNNHFQCMPFVNTWNTNIASHLNLATPIVWNTASANNLLAQDYTYDDLTEEDSEVIIEEVDRDGNVFYSFNTLPSLIEVRYLNQLISSNEYTVVGNKITLTNPLKPYSKLVLKYRKTKITTTFTSEKINTLSYTGDKKLVYGIGIKKLKVVESTSKVTKTNWTLPSVNT